MHRSYAATLNREPLRVDPKYLLLAGLALQGAFFARAELMAPTLLALIAMVLAWRGLLTRKRVLLWLAAQVTWSWSAATIDVQPLVVVWIDVAVALPWLLNWPRPLSERRAPPQRVLVGLLLLRLGAAFVLLDAGNNLFLFATEAAITVLGLRAAVAGALSGLRLCLLFVCGFVAMAWVAPMADYRQCTFPNQFLTELLFLSDVTVVVVRCCVIAVQRAIRR